MDSVGIFYLDPIHIFLLKVQTDLAFDQVICIVSKNDRACRLLLTEGKYLLEDN